MRRSFRFGVIIGVIIVVVIAAVIIGFATHHSRSGATVAVKEVDFRITMPAALPAGNHTFVVTNDGTEPHEFLVFRTDLAASALPRSGPTIDETSRLLHRVAGTTRALTPGETRTVRATLPAGRYVVVCDLPAHYGLGMRAALAVMN